ncbi:MAG: arsenite efflux transporter metallochaperone ArsD [Acidaminobacteraceae bacterium]
MKVIKIYEPSMCCSTGVCGPSIDTELLRITALMNQLNKKEKQMERFNLSDNPMVFVQEQLINQLLNEKGTEILPITVVDGKVLKTGGYPSNEEIEQFLSIELNEKFVINKKNSCSCNDGCC